ncbi:MAG: twin-arginine translocation signal domain-containing protein [Acidobacteria bacterium]|nr:twin-arginine translocation signal domain-containing protein [Acidobacteriota bacterium]
MQRRDFLKHSLALGGALSVGACGVYAAPTEAFAAPERKFAFDRVKLGPDGIELSRLAMGTGTSGVLGSSNQTRKLGVKGISELYQYGFDNGVTFWDTADQYGSHPHLRKALEYVPRDKVAIMTKSRATTAADMRADIERFRKELNTDYLDLLMLHAVTDPQWVENYAGAMDVVNEYKQKGVVRSRGISCHSLPALRRVATSNYIDVDLARINPIGTAMDADPATVVEELMNIKAAGIGVIGMKILGAGSLRHRVDYALQHALALKCVDVFTIGAESVTELSDLIHRIPQASAHGWQA